MAINPATTIPQTNFVIKDRIGRNSKFDSKSVLRYEKMPLAIIITAAIVNVQMESLPVINPDFISAHIAAIFFSQ